MVRLIDFSIAFLSVAVITAVARGSFEARGSWHVARCHPPKDGPGVRPCSTTCTHAQRYRHYFTTMCSQDPASCIL